MTRIGKLGVPRRINELQTQHPSIHYNSDYSLQKLFALRTKLSSGSLSNLFDQPGLVGPKESLEFHRRADLFVCSLGTSGTTNFHRSARISHRGKD
jgi:hypothetical protein